MLSDVQYHALVAFLPLVPALARLLGVRDAPASFGIMILIFESSRREAAAGLMDDSEETGARVRQIARDVLGLAVLRPAQVEAATALAAGRDCLAVLPSGAGKSAIYQIAGVALEGPVVVVSPLLALQREQADALRARGLSAVTVNGLSGRSARQDADALLSSGRTGFIFLGPEQLARDDVRASLTRAPVRLVAVDEAHCIASWGHDFRPDYLRLGAVIEAFGVRPAVAALTATAAPPVRREITERLGLHDPRQVIRDFDRPEIHLAVHAFHRAEDKRQAVLAAVRDQPGSGAAAGTASRPSRSAATGPRTWACSGPSSQACPITTTWRLWPARWTARCPGASSLSGLGCRRGGSPDCSTCWRRPARSGSAVRSSRPTWRRPRPRPPTGPWSSPGSTVRSSARGWR